MTMAYIFVFLAYIKYIVLNLSLACELQGSLNSRGRFSHMYLSNKHDNKAMPPAPFWHKGPLNITIFFPKKINPCHIEANTITV